MKASEFKSTPYLDKEINYLATTKEAKDYQVVWDKLKEYRSIKEALSDRFQWKEAHKVEQEARRKAEKRLEEVKKELAWYESDESGLAESLFNCGEALKKAQAERDELMKLLEVAQCPNLTCDGKGNIVAKDPETFEPILEPCQWCDNRKLFYQNTTAPMKGKEYGKKNNMPPNLL